MAKDFVTGRKTTFGKKRSHALNQTNRSWKPNLQKVRILVDGKPKKVWVSTRALKSGKVTRIYYIIILINKFNILKTKGHNVSN